MTSTRLSKLSSIRQASPFCYGFLRRALADGWDDRRISQAIVKSAALEPAIGQLWEEVFAKQSAGLFWDTPGLAMGAAKGRTDVLKPPELPAPPKLNPQGPKPVPAAPGSTPVPVPAAAGAPPVPVAQPAAKPWNLHDSVKNYNYRGAQDEAAFKAHPFFQLKNQKDQEAQFRNMSPEDLQRYSQYAERPALTPEEHQYRAAMGKLNPELGVSYDAEARRAGTYAMGEQLRRAKEQKSFDPELAQRYYQNRLKIDNKFVTPHGPNEQYMNDLRGQLDPEEQKLYGVAQGRPIPLTTGQQEQLQRLIHERRLASQEVNRIHKETGAAQQAAKAQLWNATGKRVLDTGRSLMNFGIKANPLTWVAPSLGNTEATDRLDFSAKPPEEFQRHLNKQQGATEAIKRILTSDEKQRTDQWARELAEKDYKGIAGQLPYNQSDQLHAAYTTPERDFSGQTNRAALPKTRTGVAPIDAARRALPSAPGAWDKFVHGDGAPDATMYGPIAKGLHAIRRGVTGGSAPDDPRSNMPSSSLADFQLPQIVGGKAQQAEAAPKIDAGHLIGDAGADYWKRYQGALNRDVDHAVTIAEAGTTALPLVGQGLRAARGLGTAARVGTAAEAAAPVARATRAATPAMEQAFKAEQAAARAAIPKLEAQLANKSLPHAQRQPLIDQLMGHQSTAQAQDAVEWAGMQAAKAKMNPAAHPSQMATKGPPAQVSDSSWASIPGTQKSPGPGAVTQIAQDASAIRVPRHTQAGDMPSLLGNAGPRQVSVARTATPQARAFQLGEMAGQVQPSQSMGQRLKNWMRAPYQAPEVPAAKGLGQRASSLINPTYRLENLMNQRLARAGAPNYIAQPISKAVNFGFNYPLRALTGEGATVNALRSGLSMKTLGYAAPLLAAGPLASHLRDPNKEVSNVELLSAPLAYPISLGKTLNYASGDRLRGAWNQAVPDSWDSWRMPAAAPGRETIFGDIQSRAHDYATIASHVGAAVQDPVARAKVLNATESTAHGVKNTLQNIGAGAGDNSGLQVAPPSQRRQEQGVDALQRDIEQQKYLIDKAQASLADPNLPEDRRRIDQKTLDQATAQRADREQQLADILDPARDQSIADSMAFRPFTQAPASEPASTTQVPTSVPTPTESGGAGLAAMGPIGAVAAGAPAAAAVAPAGQADGIQSPLTAANAATSGAAADPQFIQGHTARLDKEIAALQTSAAGGKLPPEQEQRLRSLQSAKGALQNGDQGVANYLRERRMTPDQLAQEMNTPGSKTHQEMVGRLMQDPKVQEELYKGDMTMKEKYGVASSIWDQLGNWKWLVIGGLGLAAISMISSMFGGGGDDEEGGGGSGAFGTLAPLLGLGAAGYGLTGGNPSRLLQGTFWRDTAQRLF